MRCHMRSCAGHHRTEGSSGTLWGEDVGMQSPAVQLVVERKDLKPVTQITSIYFLGLSISLLVQRAKNWSVSFESKSFPKTRSVRLMRKLGAAQTIRTELKTAFKTNKNQNQHRRNVIVSSPLSLKKLCF